jgi:sarcosine oxidase subunit gamma
MADPGVGARRQSPLEHLAGELAAGSAPGPDGVRIRELPFRVHIDLRGDPADPSFCDDVREALGLALPLAPNTFTRAGGVQCLWLGPDEWLIVAEPGPDAERLPRLEAALQGRHVSVVDASASRTILELSGKRAREVLAKACPLDFHPRAFRAGQCAHSNLARTQGLIALQDDSPVFHVFVRSSCAVYLALWLLDAMREYHVDKAARTERS